MIYLVLALLLIVAVLFATEIIRPDLVALGALCLLILMGVLSAPEAISAFGNPTVVMVAALFVISQALSQTGITQMVGNLISSKVKSGQYNKLRSLLMVSITSLGCFMSSTGVVALFVPITQNISQNKNLVLKRLLIPVAYAGLISGMFTLIATPANLIVSQELKQKGFESFDMLSFTPIGFAILLGALLYFIALDRFLKREDKLLPSAMEERGKALSKKYHRKDQIYRFKLNSDSPFVKRQVLETDFRSVYGIELLGWENSRIRNSPINVVDGNTILEENMILYATATEQSSRRLCEEKSVQQLPFSGAHWQGMRQKIGLMEVIVPYESIFIGMSVEEFGEQTSGNLRILGSARRKIIEPEELKRHRIEGGESLLIWGSWKDLNALEHHHKDLIAFDTPFDRVEQIDTKKARIASMITLAMIILLIINPIPPVLTILLAAMSMVLTNCLSMEQAYQSISWSTVILIAAMLPFADALDKTGGIDLLSDIYMNLFGGIGPHMLLTGVFLVTLLMGLFISNTATAVIVAPLAIQVAESSGLSPYPFAMTVAIACSAAFLTPVSSPVNLLVVSPGGYKFMDFVKTGIPMALIAMLISILLIPLLFPF